MQSMPITPIENTNEYADQTPNRNRMEHKTFDNRVDHKTLDKRAYNNNLDQRSNSVSRNGQGKTSQFLALAP